MLSISLTIFVTKNPHSFILYRSVFFETYSESRGFRWHWLGSWALNDGIEHPPKKHHLGRSRSVDRPTIHPVSISSYGKSYIKYSGAIPSMVNLFKNKPSIPQPRPWKWNIFLANFSRRGWFLVPRTLGGCKKVIWWMIEEKLTQI